MTFLRFFQQSVSKEYITAKCKLSPIHPGKILFEEFIKPMGLSQNRLALDIGMSPEFWINLQAHYDLQTQADKLGARLQREVRVHAPA